jgi:hypothetical protein
MRKRLTLVLASGLLAGCATVLSERPVDWTYKANGGAGPTDGPLALWGEPITMAFNVFRCNAPERLLEFEDIEVEDFPGARPIRFETGGQAWSGEERMKPPDGVPMSVARLPLDHPVVTALERGASAVRITGHAGSWELPSHRVVRQVIRECRKAAGR